MALATLTSCSVNTVALRVCGQRAEPGTRRCSLQRLRSSPWAFAEQLEALVWGKQSLGQTLGTREDCDLRRPGRRLRAEGADLCGDGGHTVIGMIGEQYSLQENPLLPGFICFFLTSPKRRGPHAKCFQQEISPVKSLKSWEPVRAFPCSSEKEVMIGMRCRQADRWFSEASRNG